MTPPQRAEQIDPEAHLIAVFDDAYAGFKTAYPAIRSVQ
jgi:hypothetical protein